MNLSSTLKHIVIVGCLALYTLAVAEVCVRAMSPQPLMPRYITGTPWGVRGNIPNVVYRHKTPEVNVEYRINSQGMRANQDFSFAKATDTCRVAMFGDSFFVGYELDLRDTIASQLEAELRGAGYRVEVLNFAVSGFGTGEMLRAYEGYGRQFDPDLVIFQWHSSDFDDNLRSGLYALENGQLVVAASEYLPSVSIQDTLMKWQVYRLIADNSHLYSWARERTAVYVKRLLLESRRVSGNAHASGSADVQEPQAESATSYPKQLSAALLRQAYESVRGAERSFLVVDIPDPSGRLLFTSSWDQLPPADVIGIDAVKASDVFAPLASPETKLYYERGHGHITPLAARTLARAIAERIHKPNALEHCRNETSRDLREGLPPHFQ